jgi:hypothetical protein
MFKVAPPVSVAARLMLKTCAGVVVSNAWNHRMHNDIWHSEGKNPAPDS